MYQIQQSTSCLSEVGVAWSNWKTLVVGAGRFGECVSSFATKSEAEAVLAAVEARSAKYSPGKHRYQIAEVAA